MLSISTQFFLALLRFCLHVLCIINFAAVKPHGIYRPRPIHTRKRGLEPAHCVFYPETKNAYTRWRRPPRCFIVQCVEQYLAIKNNFHITHNIICVVVTSSTTQPCQAYAWLCASITHFLVIFMHIWCIRILPAPQKRNKSGRLTFLYEFFFFPYYHWKSSNKFMYF